MMVQGMAGWSLRTKLVAAMISLLALACLVVGVTTEVTLYTVIYGRIDSQLTAAAGRAPRAFETSTKPYDGTATGSIEPGGDGTGIAPPPCIPQRRSASPPGQAIGTLSARICAGEVDADVLVEQGQTAPDLRDTHAALLSVPVGAAPRTVDLGDEFGYYRVIARGLPDGSVIVTGLPLAETQQTLYLAAAVVAGVTAVVLLSVGVTGAMIVRRTLRPLSRVAATATRVSELRLDRGEVEMPQRLADTDPRTEVGQVGAALNRMLDHVGSALRARHASETRVRQFVADASHELRTPLAAIRGYAELSRRSGLAVPAEVSFVLRRVESEAERMSTLVDDLLLLARLDTGRPLAREPVDLSMVTVNATSDAHAAAPDHDWRLDLPDEPVIVTGDAARLHQVVANLLANARTHTPPGTTVLAGVRVVGGEAVLRVLDNGPGIPTDLLPTVFERFARGDNSRSRAAGSTGLGLAIVRAVVAAHGGTVEVDSSPGRTEFTVRLRSSSGCAPVPHPDD